jgi:branched-chain amino acid transport system substrate-binding protein
MNTSRIFRIVLILTAAAICLGLPRNAPAKFTGEVRVGGIFDITGATGDVGKQYAEAVLDYVRYVNEVKGGINGQEWKLFHTDYQYQIPQAIAAYKKYKSQDQVVAILGWGTGDTEAMAPMISKDEIPYLSASYSVHLTDATKFPYNFIGTTSYSTQARVACQFVKQDWKQWAARPPRVCFMYSDTGFGRSPIADGKAEAKKLGITVVGDQIVDLKALDATSQLLNMQKEGADYIIYQNTIMSSATVAKDLHKLGLKTKMICLNWAIDEKWLELVRDAGEGVYGCVPYALWSDENLPGVQLMRKVSLMYHPELKDRTCRYAQGFSAALLMEEALKRAGAKADGKKIKAAFETFKDLDTGGLLPPVTYTATSHEPCNSLRIYQVQKGKLVPITGYISVAR